MKKTYTFNDVRWTVKFKESIDIEADNELDANEKLHDLIKKDPTGFNYDIYKYDDLEYDDPKLTWKFSDFKTLEDFVEFLCEHGESVSALADISKATDYDTALAIANLAADWRADRIDRMKASRQERTIVNNIIKACREDKP